MMKLSEFFSKLLQIALIVVGVLAIFFTYVSYNIIISQSEAEREATILGNSLLSSDCLIYSNTKNLFSDEKLDNMVADSSCFKYPYGVVEIGLLDLTNNWVFEIGTTDLGGEREFDVAVRNSITGERKPALMVVRV